MPCHHEVRLGDCLSSLAERYGLPWKKIWDHAENAELREQRRDPNVLHPCDVVYIPDLDEGHEDRPTEDEHVFRTNVVPVTLKLRLLEAGEPLAREPYVLEIDGVEADGETDDDGRIEERIAPTARRGTLHLGEHREQTLELALGGLSPVEEIAGVQERLTNVGFWCGDPDGELNDETRGALFAFQETYDLDQTGEPDRPTRDKLVELHGS